MRRAGRLAIVGKEPQLADGDTHCIGNGFHIVEHRQTISFQSRNVILATGERLRSRIAEMDDVVAELSEEISAGEWGFFARRSARSELSDLVENCRSNAEMAAEWADQTGDQQLRAQSQCFLRMAQHLGRISI